MQRKLLYFSVSSFRTLSRLLAGSACMLVACAVPVMTQAKTMQTQPVLTEKAELPQSGHFDKTPHDAASVMRGAITENAKLLKVVALARHGVRSPLQHPHELKEWSQKKWPTWPVAPGYLTPRGAELVSYLWSNLREQLSTEGLSAAPDSGCPPVGSVYVHADNEERTRATAVALLEGFAPGCGLTYVYADNEGQLVSAETMPSETENSVNAITSLFKSARPDRLFHPVHDDICVPSHRDDISTTTQINIKKMEQSLRQPLARMAKLVGNASDEFCTRFRARSGCVAPLLPSRMRISADGEAHLEGGLGIASSIAEIWLLEAAQWPRTNPAWNGLDTATLQSMLPVHTVPFNTVQRSSIIAKAQGSALLSAMVNALASPTSSVPATASLVVFVGHDTSIAHVASLLDLNWKTQSWPDNAVPPGSMLLLSLWERDGQKIVTASFVSQSLSVLRTDDPQILSQTAPEWVNPSLLEADIPAPSGQAIPLDVLLAKVSAIANTRCL